MPFTPNNNESIHNQLVDYLKDEILSKKYPTESKLPSVRDWSEELKVNPNTLQRALLVLEDEKLIYTKSTVGKFVTNDLEVLNKVMNDEIDDIIVKLISHAKMMNVGKETIFERIRKYYE